MEKLTMNVKEMAQVLGISLPKAYDLANREDFPALRLGRRIVIPKAEFKEWLSKTVTVV